MTADLEAVTRTLADVIDAAMRAVNDPGQFCKRGRNANGYVDTLNMWQRRALALALPPVLASIPDDRLAPVGNRDGVASWLQMAVGDRGPALADGLFEAGRILPDDRLAEAEAKVQRRLRTTQTRAEVAEKEVAELRRLISEDAPARWMIRARAAEAKVQRVEKHMAFRERLGSDSSPHYEIRAALSGGDAK